jgi:hypothetical protein
MSKKRPRIFHDPSEVQIDSEGNQSINIDALARDQRVRKELTKLREGFVAEQKYRESLATQAASPAEAQAAASVPEELSHEIKSRQFEPGTEEAENRSMESESS